MIEGSFFHELFANVHDVVFVRLKYSSAETALETNLIQSNHIDTLDTVSEALPFVIMFSLFVLRHSSISFTMWKKNIMMSQEES